MSSWQRGKTWSRPSLSSRRGSLEALVFALRRVTAGPLSLLLAARADAPADPLTAGTPSPPRGWRDLLAALPDAEEITLAPLDMWQVQQLLPGTVTAAQARRGPGRADLARRAGQADRADAAWRGAGQAEWLEWLQADAGNLATAVRWYLAHDPAPLPHLFRILWLFWARWDLENQAGP
jgi:hypothetical protein